MLRLSRIERILYGKIRNLSQHAWAKQKGIRLYSINTLEKVLFKLREMLTQEQMDINYLCTVILDFKRFLILKEMRLYEAVP